MVSVEQYADWRNVLLGLMTVEAFKAKWPEDKSFG